MRLQIKTVITVIKHGEPVNVIAFSSDTEESEIERALKEEFLDYGISCGLVEFTLEEGYLFDRKSELEFFIQDYNA